MEIRNPTPEELKRGDFEDPALKGFIPIEDTGGIVRTADDWFAGRIALETESAGKKALPFASHALRDEYAEKLAEWKRKTANQGYATKKKPTYDDIDWPKYSELKNFEVVKEEEISDDELSDKWRLPVTVKCTTYRFKGYKHTYSVMESKESALKRAQGVVDNVARKSTA